MDTSLESVQRAVDRLLEFDPMPKTQLQTVAAMILQTPRGVEVVEQFGGAMAERTCLGSEAFRAAELALPFLARHFRRIKTLNRHHRGQVRAYFRFLLEQCPKTYDSPYEAISTIQALEAIRCLDFIGPGADRVLAEWENELCFALGIVETLPWNCAKYLKSLRPGRPDEDRYPRPGDNEMRNEHRGIPAVLREIERRSRGNIEGELLVTVTDVSRLTFDRVARKTILNRMSKRSDARPPKQGKRGKEDLYRYSDMLRFWESAGFRHEIPARQDEAARLLAEVSNREGTR